MEKYCEVSIIKKGSFGTVSLGKRVSDRKEVVLKRIPVILMKNDEAQDVKNEISILSSLNHINIIGYCDSFMLEGSSLVIVMEYATNGTIYEFIERQEGQFIRQKIVMIIFAQLCLAVDYIHNKNIIHRDITASNVLLSGPNKIVVKLSDFGISKTLKSRRNSHDISETISLSSSSSSEVEGVNSVVNFAGTPEYMAPEIFFGKSYTKECDIWSLGCLLYFMITLKLPFPGSNIFSLANKITREIPDLTVIDRTVYEEEIIGFVCNLLDKNPSNRFKIEAIIAHPFMLRYVIDVGINLPFIQF